MTDWDHWRTVLAVFRTGTYSGAAAMLRLDATTVGRRIKTLEGRLGHRLFLREADRFHPTRQCEELLAHIEAADEALRGAEEAGAAPGQGAIWRDIRMTAPPFLITNLFAPHASRLAGSRRVRIELIGTASKAGLRRREADLAIRIEDRPGEINLSDPNIAADRVSELAYAVYGPATQEAEGLPWAGLMEEHFRTTGDTVMDKLTDGDAFRYRVHQFGALREIVASGAARAMLPCFVASRDPRLKCLSDIVLRQPLWLLHHRQDRDIPYLRQARDWVVDLATHHLDS